MHHTPGTSHIEDYKKDILFGNMWEHSKIFKIVMGAAADPKAGGVGGLP